MVRGERSTLKSQMRLVLADVLIQHLPELVQNGLVEMALRLGERKHLDTQLRHVRVELLLLELQVEGGDVSEDLRRVAVPLPALELPCRTLKIAQSGKTTANKAD